MNYRPYNGVVEGLLRDKSAVFIVELPLDKVDVVPIVYLKPTPEIDAIIKEQGFKVYPVQKLYE